MPKARRHLIINVTVLTAIELYNQSKEIEARGGGQYDLGRLLVNIGTGAFAGALPDILEPSLGNPNHRGFCHSLSAALLVWWAMTGRHTHKLSTEAKCLLVAFGVGYTCHLGADLLLSKAKGMGLVHARF